jgi:hypothetical protein
VPSTESEALLAAERWGPALVSAIAELEAALRDDAGLSPDDAVSLAKLLRAPALGIDATLRERLRRWVTMRNRHIHKHVDIAPLSARCAVSDVRRALAALGHQEG